ncbi:uncharacterized protein CDV56_100346 [Aspergillus thermomutatus]|uniref:Uncharacterized protein n=1 Tax=Aspergillus thermomutatus TaxID=41047 RepID=A0A397FWR8_ASPTH|nr:uncharacterized protein CDV56_100346 [Aspergillus thermomutatus]RHZ43212.1 hypothetical protein CDV56_100346 [Aspergillus thermomutatus]
MHFSVPILATLTMSAGIVSAINLPSTACLKIPLVIQGIDSARLIDQAQQEVCSKGCQLRMSEYETNLRGFAISVIEAESINMGTPQLNPQYINLLDSMFHLAEGECGAGELGDANLCALDVAKAKSIAQCVKANTWRVMLDNALSLWPALTTNCQKQYDFFSSPDLWEEKAPAYLREFAENCERS